MWFFKRKPEPEVIVLNLGDDDLIVLETELILSKDQREIIIKNFSTAFHDKTNRFLVLEAVFKFKVVRRT